MRKLLLIGVAAASLGGCGRGLPFFGGVTPPQRKLGFWEETRTSDQNPTPMVTRICLDAASDRRMPVLGRGPRRAGACQHYSVTHDGAAYTVDSACGFNGVTITNHTVFSGDFTSSYTAKGQVTVAGAPDPARNGAHSFTMTAVYKGDCPPDIQPGQAQLPNGQIIDLAQMRRFGGMGGGQGGGGPPGGGGPGGGGPGGGGPAGPGAGGGPPGGGGPGGGQ